MRKLFYARLAFDNLKKNARTYVPYLLSCVLTVAMTYIMYLLPRDPSLDGTSGAETLRQVLSLGSIVVTVFAVIFLFYTSSFLTKRRRAEFGLLNVLGMEKKHIARVMFFETFYAAAIGIVLGLLLGFALSKLVLLLLMNLMDFDIRFGLSFSPEAAVITALIFGAIFLATLFNSVRHVHFASPVELLRGGNVGEREPRAKWVLVLLGVATLGAGYWMAITIRDPVTALLLFFVAVILVIIGTYCLFTAGSIAVLKLLKRNRGYYYRPEHFISVSGMMYRMKQNAVGLANICILSTMVLVMLSTTTSLFLGTEGAIRSLYPREITVCQHDAADTAVVDECLAEALSARGVSAKNRLEYRSLVLLDAYCKDGECIPNPADRLYGGELVSLNCLTLDDFNRLTGGAKTLAADEALVFPYDGDTLSILGKTFRAVDPGAVKLDLLDAYSDQSMREINLVVPDMATLEALAEGKAAAYGNAASSLDRYIGFDLDLGDKGAIAFALDLSAAMSARGADGVRIDTRAEYRTYFRSFYGGLFFLGLFLGLLFVMATVLIMYYKQLSEGYDDKRRFAIMRKVGLERREIRRSVRSQVLTMFYLPLGAACLHIAFAFPFIARLFPLLGLTDTGLFAVCTIVSVAAFAVFYALTYALTARTYYRIVGSD